MKILVTGTTGLIGYNLSKRLLKEGHEVFGVIHTNEKRIAEVLYQYGDLQDREMCLLVVLQYIHHHMKNE